MRQYYDKTKNDYRYFDDAFIDNCPPLKKAWEKENKKTGISKIDFWRCAHDMPYRIVVGKSIFIIIVIIALTIPIILLFLFHKLKL